MRGSLTRTALRCDRTSGSGRPHCVPFPFDKYIRSTPLGKGFSWEMGPHLLVTSGRNTWKRRVDAEHDDIPGCLCYHVYLGVSYPRIFVSYHDGARVLLESLLRVLRIQLWIPPLSDIGVAQYAISQMRLSKLAICQGRPQHTDRLYLRRNRGVTGIHLGRQLRAFCGHSRQGYRTQYERPIPSIFPASDPI
jgi:hypothetical protein